MRVDHYWRNIFKIASGEGQTKYPFLQKLIKSALVLPHGNADVERSLSVNVVTRERTHLSGESITGIRMIKDAVMFYNPKDCRQLPFNKELYI